MDFERAPRLSLEAATGSENTPTQDVTVLMPIGGKATRAREVTRDLIPKHLIRLDNGQTVLDVVCQGLSRAGFKQFVFCVGHLKDQIIEHVRTSPWINDEGIAYDFSEEKTPLGGDGAVVNAIGTLGLQGKGLIVPGDMMLPWRDIADMSRAHSQRGADVMIGVTSYVTDRTTDVGRIVLEDHTNRILWCYNRTEELPPAPVGVKGLTSAAAATLSMDRYLAICDTYLDRYPESVGDPLNFRDQILPWASRIADFQIFGYDLRGEALDLGTPANINYGQANWSQYA